MHLLSVLFCLAALLAPALFAQAPASLGTSTKLSDSPLPKDPAAALALLRKVNGLGEDTQPWHVHASYQTFDEQGKPAGTGTFEMWWASPTKYKQVFASDSFHQTEYGTEHGVLRVGYSYSAPYPESFLVSELIHPLPSATDVAAAELEMRELNVGTVKWKCLMLSQSLRGVAVPPVGLFPSYCTGSDKPILRFSIRDPGNEITRNSLVLFRDSYLAKEVMIHDEGRTLMKIAVDQISSLGVLPDSFFTPPPEAATAGSTIDVGPGMLSLKVIHKGSANYPAAAKKRRAEGMVVLSAVIGRDGHPHELSVLEAPDPDLAISAVVNVRQWVYEPYMVEGKPVEIHTTIHVEYRLGG